jgi:acyl-CoA thioesterase-1
MDFALKRIFSSDYFARAGAGGARTGSFYVLLAGLFFQGLAAAGPRVMVYGDSLSAAYGLDPKDGWVALMAKKLAPQGVEIINSSISGETSGGGLARIRADLALVKPTVVVLELGANDALRGLPVADTRKNLLAIVAACRDAKAKVILVGIQIPPNYGLDYARQFRDLYPELAAREKLALVPFLLEGIADKLELFQPDRLHPTAEAQPRIVDNVLPVVRSMLPTLQKPAKP